VLEIGTGCGYQSAILAKLADEVWSVEAVDELAQGAQKRLDSLKLSNVYIRSGDGFHGWPQEAPFDVVIVTAAPEYIPPHLIEQLKPGGVMVLPVGRPHDHQMLFRLVRRDDGGYDSQEVLPVAFVPLIEQE
jgi:protein-L-isoaspartate(D-aspartate) O-methyltransferase